MSNDDATGAPARRTDEEYLNFNPFEGDRDVRIECHRVKLLTTREKHLCMGVYARDDNAPHDIPAGTRVWRETAKVDGQFGTCYVCLDCMDILMGIMEAHA